MSSPGSEIMVVVPPHGSRIVRQLDQLRYLIDDKQIHVSFSKVANIFRAKVNGEHIYNIYIRALADHSYEIWIKQHVIQVKLEDNRSRLLKHLQRGREKVLHSIEIIAPMPGRVVGVLVKEGDYVQKGAGLIILEAMKMENKIISHLEGSVVRINVKQGDITERNQVLMSIREGG